MKNSVAIIIFFLFANANAQKPIFATAKIKAATVYFNGAELVQNTSVNLPAGNSEIVIKNIANSLVESSIRVGSSKNVTVLSVQFSTNYITEFEIDQNNPTIKKAKDSLRWVEKEISKYNSVLSSTTKSIEILDKNQQVSGQNTGLNVAELMKFMDYYNQKRMDLSNNLFVINQKIANLETLEGKWNNQLDTNSKKNEKTTSGKLVLQVINSMANETNFDISYLTNTATWAPMYDLKVTDIGSPIDLNYKAQIAQTSGIDWKKVKLTLSSGIPNQNNVVPDLNTWFLKYLLPKQESLKDKEIATALAGRVSGLQVEPLSNSPSSIILRGSRSLDGQNNALIIIDGVQSSASILAQLPQEIIKTATVLKGEQARALYGEQGANGVILITTKQGMNDFTTISQNQLNVSFDIDLPYDILSNVKKHTVDLKELKIPAQYHFYSVPKLSNEAFLIAEIADYSKYNLLTGPANISFENLFVGKTVIKPNSVSDSLKISLGADKRIAIERVKIVDKSDIKFLSNYKIQTFSFETTIKNNKKDAIHLILKDQIPISTDKDIIIELKESELSTVNFETGILTYDMKLQPSEIKKIKISYTIKYPKDKKIMEL